MASAALRLSPADALLEMVSKGRQSKAHNNNLAALNYAGDLSSNDVYGFLVQQGGMLVDVRTPQEWQTVGTPDLADKAAKISWKTAPNMQLNPRFLEELAVLPINKDTPVFFLCRSGGRSLDAAIAATEAGYKYAFNIEYGYEGEPNAAGERCTINGWKAANLPWKHG